PHLSSPTSRHTSPLHPLPTRRSSDLLTRLQNGVGLLRLSNHSDRTSSNPCLLANRFRKLHLIARPNRNLHSWHDAAAGHVDEIHTESLQSFAQLDGLLQVPTALFPISRGNANE